jgi:hypothetical protein
MEELREAEGVVDEYGGEVTEVVRHSRVCEERRKAARARFMRGFTHVT